MEPLGVLTISTHGRGEFALEEAEIPLEANGQTSWFIEDTFTTDTSDFLGVGIGAGGLGRSHRRVPAL
jgi:hypothetical protein